MHVAPTAGLPMNETAGAPRSRSKGQLWLQRCNVLFDAARRAAKPLSAIALCIENYEELKTKFGAEGVEQAMGVIGKAIAASLAPTNATGRLARAFFVTISPAVGAKSALDQAERLERHISAATLTLGRHAVTAHARGGTASSDTDNVASAEELMKLAVHRALARVKRVEGESGMAGCASPTNDAVTLTPGERAVLRQIIRLESQAPSNEYQFNAVSTGWPVSHRAAYMAAYEGLIIKGFIALTATPQAFTVTTKGLRAAQAL